LDPLRARRRAGGVNEIFRIASRTVSAVSGATPCCSLRTRETVEAETPATVATLVNDIADSESTVASAANTGRNYHLISAIYPWFRNNSSEKETALGAGEGR
jgi:hypothetical protein